MRGNFSAEKGRCDEVGKLNQRPTVAQRTRCDRIIALRLMAVGLFAVGALGHGVGWAIGCAVWGLPL